MMAHIPVSPESGKATVKASRRPFSLFLSMIFLLWLPRIDLQDAEAYCRSPWNSLKTAVVTQIMGKMEKIYTTKSSLQQYYDRKYPEVELKSVRDAIATVLPNLNENEQEQAAREVLSFHHVVYHRTEWHRIERNVRIERTYENLIEKFGKRYEVPPPLAKGIICWENSGDVSKISYAQCGGLGQLSQGALDRAHRYGKDMAHYKIGMAKVHDFLYKSTGKEVHRLERDRNLVDAKEYDLEARHRDLSRAFAVADERLVPECNAEDAVIFMKVLLDYYNGQPDLAIASYHNGVNNTDDLLRDYISRRMPWLMKDRKGERDMLMLAVSKFRINYLSLWSDQKSREMLSGYRTMDGDVTTASNRSEALGDESDIYLWKIVASYAALLCPEKSLMERIGEYRKRWDVVECRGLKLYNDNDGIKEAIAKGELVKLPPVNDRGIGKIPMTSQLYERSLKHYNYHVTPELTGFIDHISAEFRASTGNEKALIPTEAALQSKVLYLTSPPDSGESEEFRTHLQGVAIDVAKGGSNSDALYLILNRYYLRDRIYLIGEKDHWHVCLNPRYGNEFYQYYSTYRTRQKKRN
jgi:hypothetical protein